MIIIVEGPDGAGKTTLAKELAARTNARYLHKGAPSAPLLEEYALPGTGDFILDRWHVGEAVYGPLRRDTQLPPQFFPTVEEPLRKAGAVLAVLVPPLEVLEKRLADRGEDPIPTLNKERIAFADAFLLSTLDKWYMPTVYEPVFVDNLIAMAEREERRVAS